MRDIKLENYLKDELVGDSQFVTTLRNLSLLDVPLRLITKTFREFETKEDLVNFLKNPDNHYALGILGYRYKELKSEDKAYNGMRYSVDSRGKSTILENEEDKEDTHYIGRSL